MGLRVNTNVASINAQRNLGAISNRLGGNYARLSSGLRIANAADDAAGLAVSERLRSQIRSYGVNARNAQDGISLVQTAEGALGEVSNQLGRLRELAVQASNGTLSTEDRATIDVEYQAIKAEITRLSDETEFNGVKLLDNTTALNIQIGLDSGDSVAVTPVAVDTVAGTIGAVTSETLAIAELAVIDTAVQDISEARGALGASQNRLQSAFASINNVRENLSAAESRIRDVDIASETADLTRNSILQQAATSVLGQANAQPQLALSLLG